MYAIKLNKSILILEFIKFTIKIINFICIPFEIFVNGIDFFGYLQNLSLDNFRYNIFIQPERSGETMDLYQNYLSPFSWRYASQDMRSLWSENQKRKMWRQIWIALAKTQSRFGLVSPEQITDLEKNADNIDMDTALNLEAEIHHDLMAELKTFASQCPLAGGILHLGATSMDIEDNADALRMRAALDLILKSLAETLTQLVSLIEKYIDLPVMGYTHIQPAEPTTLGYRLSIYAQDLLEDFLYLKKLQSEIRGKGFKGAVGTAAAYADLIGFENLEEFETELSQVLQPFILSSYNTNLSEKAGL